MTVKIDKRSLVLSLLAGSFTWLTFSIPLEKIDWASLENIYFVYPSLQVPVTVLYVIGSYEVFYNFGQRRGRYEEDHREIIFSLLFAVICLFQMFFVTNSQIIPWAVCVLLSLVNFFFSFWVGLNLSRIIFKTPFTDYSASKDSPESCYPVGIIKVGKMSN